MPQTNMPLFHASASFFEDGQVVTASNPTGFYTEAVVELEKKRPSGAPSRSICMFASDNAEFATFFLLRQQVPLAQVRLYEVEMPVNWRAPIALVHTLSKRLQEEQDGSTLIAEYWNPVKNWNFHEVFGPEMTIKRLLPAPAVNQVILSIDYSGEANRAAKV